MANEIRIVSEVQDEDESVPKRLGALPPVSDKARKLVEERINSEDVRNSMLEICSQFKPENIDPKNEYGIDEVELAFVVSGTAGVRLIGEVQTGMQASIKVKIKRK